MIYCLVHMTVSNPEKLGQYREMAGAALAKHGGELVKAMPKPDRLEGTLPVPDMAGVLSFPDRDAALAWINDPELAEVHALRRDAADSSIFLLA